MLSEDGYVKVRVGVDHPLADPNGYAYEHLVIWCAAGNPPPSEGYLLHHKDEDRQNNRLGNLALIERGDHNAHHLVDRGRDDLGRFLRKEAGVALLDGREWREWPR